MTSNLSLKTKKKLGVLIPVLGILFCLLYYYRSFLAGQAFGWDDDLYQFYPGANYFSTSIAEGTFPFWLPGLRCGMPFYSDVQMGVFYPLKWLLVLFVKDGELSQHAYQGYLVFQYFVGGLLFYALMRMHERCRISSVTGALVYCFSGFTALHIIFFASVEVMMWLPLVLMAIKCYFKKKSLRRVLLISLAVLMTFLPGFPQVTVYVSYFSIGYWLVLALYERIEKGGGGKSVTVGLMQEFVVIALTFLLAISMGAIAFFPAFENWQLSSRATYGYDKIADTSMPFYYMVNMFFPNFTGVMKPIGTAVQYWGFNQDTIGFRNYRTAYWHYWDLSCYAGQIGIIALLYSVVFIRSFWRSPFRLVCTLGALFALWFMFGRYGGLFKVLYEILPGISAFRGPGRMSCVFNMAQAILSTYFISDLICGKNLPKIRSFLSIVVGSYLLFFCAFLVFGKSACKIYENVTAFNFSVRQIGVAIGFSGIILAVSFLVGRERIKPYKGWVFSILFLSVFMDLYGAHGGFHKGEKKAKDYFADRGNLIVQLQAYQEKNGICRFAQVRGGRINENIVLPRNTGFMQEIEVPEGYVLFNLMSVNRVRTNLPEEMVRDLLNIGVIAEQTQKGVGLKVRQPLFPRAMFYSKVAAFDSREALFEALSTGTVDYKRQIAVLKSDLANVKIFEGEQRQDACSVRKINNNEWKISFTNQGSGIIFISQSYYPGWKAFGKDGVEYDIIETFGGLTGIVIPETGSGLITFRFSPQQFIKGAIVSFCTITIVLVILIFPRSRKSAVNKKQ